MITEGISDQRTSILKILKSTNFEKFFFSVENASRRIDGFMLRKTQHYNKMRCVSM